jgi:hypothetical protein
MFEAAPRDRNGRVRAADKARRERARVDAIKARTDQLRAEVADSCRARGITDPARIAALAARAVENKTLLATAPRSPDGSVRFWEADIAAAIRRAGEVDACLRKALAPLRLILGGMHRREPGRGARREGRHDAASSGDDDPAPESPASRACAAECLRRGDS